MRLEDICLCILFHNPEMVKVMLPELATRGVRGMRFATMGTGFSISGEENRGDLLGCYGTAI